MIQSYSVLVFAAFYSMLRIGILLEDNWFKLLTRNPHFVIVQITTVFRISSSNIIVFIY